MRHTRASVRVCHDTTVYSPYGETLLDQLSVCSRMSSHYRRLYGSKSVVDTSQPRRFGPCRTTARNSRNVSSGRTEQSLVDAVVYDSRNSPSIYRCLKDGGKNSVRRSPSKPLSQKCSPLKKKSRDAYDLIECHADCFVAPGKPFQPRILKSEAESKVRHLRTYHPPRNKGKQLSAAEKNEAGLEEEEEAGGDYSQDEWELPDTEQSQDANVRSDSARSEAKASSCDSAYSGGVSSCRESCKLSRDHRPDDIQYAKFIHEITEDVLQRGVFTNKGLQMLFQLHIKRNESVLDKERMLKEVQILSEELGISEEVVSSFGNLNMMVHDGKARSLSHGNDKGAELSWTGGVAAWSDHQDKLQSSDPCRDSRECIPLSSRPEQRSSKDKCTCARESRAFAPSRKTSVHVGLRSHPSTAGRLHCSCRQTPEIHKFWMAVSNTNGSLSTSSDNT